MDPALGSSFSDPFEGNLASLDSPPDFCPRNDQREVDEFESTGDIPILVMNFPGGDFGNVISTKYAEGCVRVEVPSEHHDGMRFSVCIDPITEMLVDNFVLNIKVKAEGYV